MIVSDAAVSSGDVMRRLAELEARLREMDAGRRLESATIGSGGLKVRGGEIRVQNADGTIDHAVMGPDGVSVNGSPLTIPGSIASFAGPVSSLPSGWVVCDGVAVSRTTYAALFAAIGTTWGAGDGSSTFNLPDLRDRMLVGAGLSYAVGATGGATTHSHTNPTTGNGGGHSHTNPSTGTTGDHGHASAGSHGHTTGGPSTFTNASAGADFGAADTFHGHTVNSGGSHSHPNAGSHGHTVGATGGVGDHSHGVGATAAAGNLPPYAAVLPIIRY